MEGWRFGRRAGRLRARPLRQPSTCTGVSGAGGSISGAAGDPAALCRICWSEAFDDGGELVAPCQCSGSMRHVHLSCLALWQAQLRVQKGVAASQRCDVCRARWAKQYAQLGAEHQGRWALLAATHRAILPWVSTVLQWWRCVALAQGVLHGIEAGAQGFRLGLRYRTVLCAPADQRALASFLGWAPISVLAAGVAPPVHVPMFLAMYTAFSMVGALPHITAALAGAYAGGVTGFVHGVSRFAAGSAHALRCTAMAASMLASKVVQGVLRWLLCWM